MGVDYRQYIGFGVKLANRDTYAEIVEKLGDADPKYGDMYSVEFEDDHIEIVADQMCGDYIYLLYSLDDYDIMWDSGSFEISMTELTDAHDESIRALQGAYEKLGLGELKPYDVRFISMTHVW